LSAHYSRLCSRYRRTPTIAPRPTVPRMNGRARGIASQATTTSPIETTAPAFVPGTGMFPKASRCGCALCRGGICSNMRHLDGIETSEANTRVHDRQERGQRLKPTCSSGPYGTVETVPYKTPRQFPSYQASQAAPRPSINLNDRSAGRGRLRLQTRCNSASHCVDALGPRRVRTEQCDRFPGIAADTDLRIDFDLAEQRHAVGVRDAPPFAMSKNVD